MSCIGYPAEDERQTEPRAVSSETKTVFTKKYVEEFPTNCQQAFSKNSSQKISIIAIARQLAQCKHYLHN
jgi:hypothetical protein